jgi:NAD(P)H dehydrogenase (quinone)
LALSVLFCPIKEASLLLALSTTEDGELGVKRKILITGATGQVGSRTINRLLDEKEKEIETVAAIHSPRKAASFTERGIATVILDLDDERTHLPALQGVHSLFVMTGYTIDMLRQSKALLDNAKKAGVQHVVHLGACGRDDTTVAHWAWHQFVERYIEWAGFSGYERESVEVSISSGFLKSDEFDLSSG